jgi:hypothetical protein
MYYMVECMGFYYRIKFLICVSLGDIYEIKV